MKFLIPLLGLTVAVWAETTPDSVPARQEPHHHVMFENDALRILSVLVPPGEETLNHSHDHDDASVCISGSNMRGKSGAGEWSKPGQPCTLGRAGLTQWAGKAGSHAVGNTGESLFQLVLVENLHTEFSLDSTPLNSEIGSETVTRENRAFRVFEIPLAAASEKSHTHTMPVVTILISGDAQFDGKHVTETGTWVYVPAGQTHSLKANAASQLVELEIR